MTGGPDGGKVHPHAERNLELLKSVVYIPRRVQQHELEAYLGEILKQGIYEKGHMSRWSDIKQRVQRVDSTLTPPKQHHFALCFNHEDEEAEEVTKRMNDQKSESRHPHNAIELGFMLSDLGFKVDPVGLPEDLEKAECLVVFSGGWQEKSEAPEFRALFSDKHCRRQILQAQSLSMTVVGIRETEPGWGPSALQHELDYCGHNFDQAEKERCADWLGRVDWLDRRYHAHEIAPFLSEVLSLGIKKRRCSLEDPLKHRVLNVGNRKSSELLSPSKRQSIQTPQTQRS